MLHFLKTAKTISGRRGEGSHNKDSAGEDTVKTRSSILLITKGRWVLGENQFEEEKPER